MSDGTVPQVIRRLVPPGVRWLVRAALKRITGLYYRDIMRQQRNFTERLDAIQHQVTVALHARLDAIQHQVTVILPTHVETQGEVLDLLLRRMRLSEEEVASHLHTLEERVAERLSALGEQVGSIDQRVPGKIMTLADNEPWLTEHLLMKGDIFLDVGASIGTYSFNLAPGYRKVFAFEPHPRARKELLLNVAGLDNVIVNGQALYSHTGVVGLYLYSNDAQSSVLPTHEEAEAGPPVGEILVHCVRLDDIEFDGHVDFVKVDCEGAEVDIIAGAVNTIAKHKPQLLVEIHSKKNGPKIRKILDKFGYRCARISNPRRTHEDPFWQHHYWLSCLGR